MNKALLLINIGTPAQPKVREVRRFLSAFLNDPRVITLPTVLRYVLVNLLIIPLRVGRSTRLYQKLWTGTGSPVLAYLERLCEKLQALYGSKYTVYGAMRYGQPSLQTTLEAIDRQKPGELVVLPLFPQYASSTTGSASAYVLNFFRNRTVVPSIRFINQFYHHPAFIDSVAKMIKDYDPESYDQVVFSYHGLPISHLRAIHGNRECANCHCENQMPECGQWCYKAACYHTTRLLINHLGLPKGSWSVGFQSRLTRQWISPFTDTLLVQLALDGKRNVLVVSPSFVADCLETIIEIELEYRVKFLAAGGNRLVLVPSLNDEERWVEAVHQIVG